MGEELVSGLAVLKGESREDWCWGPGLCAPLGAVLTLPPGGLPGSSSVGRFMFQEFNVSFQM